MAQDPPQLSAETARQGRVYVQVQWVPLAGERLSFYDVRGSAVPRSVLSAIALLAQDKDTIKEYSKSNFDVEMEDVHLSYKGWNWGECGIENGLLTFKVEDKLASDIPLADITQAAAQGPQGKEKNEAVIEMAVDDTAMPEDEILVEMRVRWDVYSLCLDLTRSVAK